MNISIIVPTVERYHFLQKLLESLTLAQKPSCGFEVIIAVNSSSPAIYDRIQKLAANYDLPLRLMVESLRGKSFALNRALTSGVGEIVAFLDDDVVVQDGYLIGIEKTIVQSNYRIFGGPVYPVWPVPVPKWLKGGGEFSTSRGNVIVHDYGTQPREYDSSMKVPIGCNFFCHREVFRQFGLFDTRLGRPARSGHGFMGTEDTELLLRFRRSGENILYSPIVAVYHPIDPMRLTKSAFRARAFIGGHSRPYIIGKTSKSFMGVPRYIFRALIADIFKSIWLALTRSGWEAFDKQLVCFSHFGAIAEYLRPTPMPAGSHMIDKKDIQPIAG